MRGSPLEIARVHLSSARPNSKVPSYRKLYGEPFERLRRILIGVRSEKNCPINLELSTVKNVAVMEFASPDGQWDPLGDLLNKWG